MRGTRVAAFEIDRTSRCRDDHKAFSHAGNPDAALESRLRNAEAAIEALRAAVANNERDNAVMRADLERLRVESERAAGVKLP
jgi:hypothetical protein